MPEDAANASPEVYAKFDLSSTMTPFFDRHLIFPMFQFFSDSGIYSKEDVAQAEVKLLAETNMIDFTKEKMEEIGMTLEEDLDGRRAEVLESLSTERDKVLEFLKILEDEEQLKRLLDMKNIKDACQEFDLPPDIIDDLIKYAKLQYECGIYGIALDLLKKPGHHLCDAESLSTTTIASCKWGLLACNLLTPNYEEAAKLIAKLDEFLLNTKLSKKEMLQQQSWLLHWSLIAIFKDVKPDSKVLDLLLCEKSTSVIIPLACPHLFRYVGAVLVLQKRYTSANAMKEIVKHMHQDGTGYNDPITKFLFALYIDIDFDQAQTELKQCELVCKADYFLYDKWAEFEENARLLIFETYCRIHQCINIGMIASRLNMGEEEAELWIVKLIQNAKLDARIDSEKSRVVMSKAAPSVYQQVIDKTKNLAFKSTVVLSNLESAEKERIASAGA